MRNLTAIVDLFKEAPSTKVERELFDLLFTHEELVQLNNRYGILKKLVQGKQSQRAIAVDLKLSIAKITRGSNALKRMSPALRAYIKECFDE